MIQFSTKFAHVFLLLVGSFSKWQNNDVPTNTLTSSKNDNILDNRRRTRTSLCHNSRESNTNDPTTATTSLSPTTCERISSCDAALLIQNAYRKHHSPDIHSNNDESLLLITSDASRGANRHSGLAAILREIQYTTIANNRNHDETNHIVPTCDRVTIATRRMHSQNARDISKLEVAAVAMGVRTAIKYISPERRRNVLILTDSNSALDFYCRKNDDVVTLMGKGDSLFTAWMNDPHYKAMQMMLQNESNINEQGMRKGGSGTSSAKSCRIFMAKVKSNKFENDGFFDHDAADIISSAIKNRSNKQASEIYSWGNDGNDINDNDPTIGERFDKEILDDLSTRRLSVPCLRNQDIDFLALSETKVEAKLKKPQVVVKRERGERLERSKQRIKEELGIYIF